MHREAAKIWTDKEAQASDLQLVAPHAQLQEAQHAFDASVWNTFSSRDLEAVHEHMTEAFCPHRLQIDGKRSPLAFQHRQAQLDTVSFNTTEYGQSAGNILVDIPPSEHLYLVQFVLSGNATFEQNGQRHCLTPGHLSILNPQSEVKQITHPECRHFTIKLDQTLLNQILVSEIGGYREALAFGTGPVALTGTTGSFARYVQRVCADLEDAHTGFVHPKVAGALEDALARLLLISVPHNYSDEFSRAGKNAVAPYYIKRVEEFVHDQYRRQICLSDLIAVSGVSGRSLHSGFRKFRNTTPMGFLKSVRINAAHAALKTGIEQGLSVTDIAISCGFPSPGKFSQDYKRHFGVSPSVTLKQTR